VEFRGLSVRRATINKKRPIRVNYQIRVPRVRVVGPDGTQLGIFDSQTAIQMAQQEGLDLVEVAPDASPPVCRIMDFGKYKYELAKKEKLQKKKQHVIHVKEIRLRPKIEEHDFQVKLKHAREFLEDGDRVKVTVIFRGREMAHQEFGRQIMDRIKMELGDVARVDKDLLMEGRTMVMYLAKK